MENNLQTYIVQTKKEEVPGVFTLNLLDENNKIPKFTAGQYISIYFPETKSPEGKAYSISNAPHEPAFSITVRAIGEFSNKICSLGEGDKISASLPYGFFCIEKEDSDLVMLASGIGITPFRSMISDALKKNFSRSVFLFHSIRNSDDAIFQKDFDDLKKKAKNFSVTYFVTKEENSTISNAFNRRMQAKDILNKINTSNLENTEFLICGSISFTRDMWKGLCKEGIPEDQILTEAFFSH